MTLSANRVNAVIARINREPAGTLMTVKRLVADMNAHESEIYGAVRVLLAKGFVRRTRTDAGRGFVAVVHPIGWRCYPQDVPAVRRRSGPAGAKSGQAQDRTPPDASAPVRVYSDGRLVGSRHA